MVWRRGLKSWTGPPCNTLWNKLGLPSPFCIQNDRHDGKTNWFRFHVTSATWNSIQCRKIISKLLTTKSYLKQGSSPAWPQEAYQPCPPCQGSLPGWLLRTSGLTKKKSPPKKIYFAQKKIFCKKKKNFPENCSNFFFLGGGEDSPYVRHTPLSPSPLTGTTGPPGLRLGNPIPPDLPPDLALDQPPPPVNRQTENITFVILRMAGENKDCDKTVSWTFKKNYSSNLPLFETSWKPFWQTLRRCCSEGICGQQFLLHNFLK